MVVGALARDAAIALRATSEAVGAGALDGEPPVDGEPPAAGVGLVEVEEPVAEGAGDEWESPVDDPDEVDAGVPEVARLKGDEFVEDGADEVVGAEE